MTVTETRPLALVTGASSGVGLELARLFARHGYDLVMNSEDARLDEAAAAVRATGAEVNAVRADLRGIEGIEKLLRAVAATGPLLDAAALDVGVGWGGAFLDSDIADEIEIVDLTIISTLRLAKRLLRPMVARGAGRVLVTTSVAPLPGRSQAVHEASMSFLQSLTAAVQEELKYTGVTITAVMPGLADDPAQVARQGFEAMMRGRACEPRAV
jgi:short-subunit dehydrogenase